MAIKLVQCYPNSPPTPPPVYSPETRGDDDGLSITKVLWMVGGGLVFGLVGVRFAVRNHHKKKGAGSLESLYTKLDVSGDSADARGHTRAV